MAFSKGLSSDYKKNFFDSFSIPEADLASAYLGINSFPKSMRSPLREDKHPSFYIYITDKGHVRYRDFATGENDNIYHLLSLMWNTSFPETLEKIKNDFQYKAKIDAYKELPATYSPKYRLSKSILQVRERPFNQRDLDYWSSYGISSRWLKFADVHAISHIFITKDCKQSIIPADKYAYAYVEHKEGKTTMKIYQPFNKKGFKWMSKHDHSVISLWTKIPQSGPTLLICSSLKDALCLWANVHIPAIALQGEGFPISSTALSQLKERFTNIFIALDGDEAGVKDSIALHEKTGLPILSCPIIDKAKDWSDIYHFYGQQKLISTFQKSMQEATPIISSPSLF